MIVKMKALRPQTYGTKVLNAGDTFDADNEQDAKTLSIVGHAERAVEDEPKRAYRRRDMRAEH